MAFGNGTMNTERRKTSHINNQFRSYLKETASDVIGLPLDERQALTIFKVLMRTPLRFLMTLEEEDFDPNNERSLAVAGIGKFKIINTVAQGKRKSLVGEGEAYPRYKFYPSSIMEHEVEMLHGIGDENSKEVYDRTISSEEHNKVLNSKEIAKIVKKLVDDSDIKTSTKHRSIKSLGSLVDTVLKEQIQAQVESILKSGNYSIPQVEYEDDKIEDVEVEEGTPVVEGTPTELTDDFAFDFSD